MKRAEYTNRQLEKFFAVTTVVVMFFLAFGLLMVDLKVYSHFFCGVGIWIWILDLFLSFLIAMPLSFLIALLIFPRKISGIKPFLYAIGLLILTISAYMLMHVFMEDFGVPCSQYIGLCSGVTAVVGAVLAHKSEKAFRNQRKDEK